MGSQGLFLKVAVTPLGSPDAEKGRVGGEADPDDLPQIVEAGRLTESPEVRHRAVLPAEGMKDERCGGLIEADPDDLTQVVDAGGRADCPAREGPEIRHRAVLPEEGAVGPRARVALADDLSPAVDIVGHAEAAAHSPKVGHRPD